MKNTMGSLFIKILVCVFTQKNKFNFFNKLIK